MRVSVIGYIDDSGGDLVVTLISWSTNLLFFILLVGNCN